MNKLLRADFSRLFKDTVFKLSIAVSFLAGLGSALMRVKNNIDYDGAFTMHLNESFLPLAILLVLVCSAFTSLFLGTEYSEATVRNKVIAGHGRCAICLSGLICALAATLVITAAFLLPYYAVGLPTVGFSEDGSKDIVSFTAVFTGMLLAFTSLFAMLVHIVRNKAYSAVCCILLAIFMTVAGIWISGRLAEPEYYSAYASTADGGVVETKAEKNPNYVDGTGREALRILLDVSSGGQLAQLDGFDSGKTVTLIACDLAVIVLCGFGAALILKKRDLS